MEGKTSPWRYSGRVIQPAFICSFRRISGGESERRLFGDGLRQNHHSLFGGRDTHAPAKSVPRVREARLFHFFAQHRLTSHDAEFRGEDATSPSISCARGTKSTA